MRDTDLDELVALARRERVELAVIGPEVPLSLGLRDRLSDAGVPVFGPSQSAARLESSKAFAKDLMARYGIPTARFRVFQDADAARQEVLEEVAVVRRELDDEALAAETEPFGDRVDIAPCVLDPGIGVRREIGVLGEDLVGSDERRDLREPAVGAHLDVERIEGLHVLQALRREEALAERRLAEVDHRQLERRVTDAAMGPAGYDVVAHPINVAGLRRLDYPRPGSHPD